MEIDIILVTYNSAQWISKYFNSLLNCGYNLNLCSIVVVDNLSQDLTLTLLEDYKQLLQMKNCKMKIIKNQNNLGFGQANNIGFKAGASEIVCFMNIDTEVLPGTFDRLEKEVNEGEEEVGLWEFRQLPYEHPKAYDIRTNYTSWSSGAAFAVRRKVYEQVGGFDSAIFMYGEDVDLSWRIRAQGYKLKYCPHIPIIHYAYEQGSQPKPTQFIYSTIYNSLLRYRYGKVKDIFIGHILAAVNVMRPKPCTYSRKQFVALYLKEMRHIPHFIKTRVKSSKENDFKPYFIRMQYEQMREGAFYYCELPVAQPLVSIIIRTCQRPEALKEAIASCLGQTYKNIEIIIVEDGENYSEDMITHAFKDERISYYATMEKVGRSKAGNIGMERAHGKYIGFLDDDDLYYADHVETLVKALEDSDNQVAYGIAEESQIIKLSRAPYKYEEKQRSVFYKQSFNRARLFYHNYIPIQCVLFERSLFLTYGGLDEKLDALEDWDLWVRYACHTDFTYIEKVTSIYRVPYQADESVARQEVLDAAMQAVRQKHYNYLVECSAGEIGEQIESILASYKILKLKKFGKNLKNKYPKLFKLVKKIKR